MAENRHFQKYEICYIIDSALLSLPLLWGNMVRKPQHPPGLLLHIRQPFVFGSMSFL